jgi:hypothetical protein
VSAETLQAIEDAIVAHHRASTTHDKPERSGALVTGWVVGYEISNIVDIGEPEGSVLGFANDCVASDSSPNLLSSLASWAADEIRRGINGSDIDE